MSPNLDIAVVRSVPLIERFENVNLMPAEMKSPGQGHSAIVSMARREYAFLAPRYIRSDCFVSSAVKCCRAGFLARTSLRLPVLGLSLQRSLANSISGSRDRLTRHWRASGASQGHQPHGCAAAERRDRTQTCRRTPAAPPHRKRAQSKRAARKAG
jgi:hypothetical protein